VPYPPGGPTDVVARVIADRMRVALGQTVIVENVAGGSGSIGVGRVARAVGDGYTLSVGNNGSHVLNAALYTLPYDMFRDFEPVGLLTSNPQIIVTRKTVPAKDLSELIAWIKANPGKVSVGSAGAVAAVSAAFFQNLTATNYTVVPYRGAAPAIQDLMGGQIDMMFDQLSNALPQVRAGTIRGYAVTAKTRALNAPEIPTADEAGLPKFYAALWQGMWAPKGTPKNVIARLNAAIGEALADPKVEARLREIGQEPFGADQRSVEALATFQRAEADKWWPIIKAANLKGD
ncbi:MAG TPA: tripartite tricarboxylate transporter substrate-binding protein, partial [Xanthobacteraceae bacterium]